MPAIARQPIDAGADKEGSAEALRQAVEFVDVTFAVADMDATLRLSESFDGLSQIVESAGTFLLFVGNARRVDLSS
ncbi:hypothetical protein [Bradyrhizobium sp. WSM3983]|uniref:hypothetical protein n=1 Tax=Bradyrhizobium sp. WSM3983 TaxID=1038867 RepID=UPI000481FF4B|nr:hypothetical protein [Bradyrhizobium sp. WSM3983]